MNELIAGRELDALIAVSVMGWTVDQRNPATVYSGYDACGQYSAVPSYSTDIAAARLIEDHIELSGRVWPYIEALVAVLDLDIDILPSAIEAGSPHAPDMRSFAWDLIRATPEQKCLAALKALP